MRRVMAQGTFDVIHPGHLHYFRESAALGDELHVVIARDSRMSTRKDLFMDEASRCEIVSALEMVDSAVLGSEGSIFASVDRIDPDVITLGYDQEFDPDTLESQLGDAGYKEIDVVRISGYDEASLIASSEIKTRIKHRYGPGVFHSVTNSEKG